MNGLTFAQPLWFWGMLALLPLIVLRIVGHFRTARSLAGLVSPRLVGNLVAGASISRRWTVFLMRLLGLACVIVALARPQMGFEEIPVETDAHNLLLAIDTSKSMMADDLTPNRLARSKLAAIDLVRALPEDRIGVIAFAGMAFLQAPFTVDHEAITETIDELDTEIIQRGGSNLSAVVKLAVDTVKELQSGSSVLVLFSDGEAFEGLSEIEKVREAAKEAGLSILAVGVGTEAGSIIPETSAEGRVIPGSFVKDEQGQIVKTRLEPASLQALASEGGRYLHLDGATPLAGAVDQLLSDITRTREEGKAAMRPLERFLWPLSVGFVLLVLSHLIPLLWRKPAPARRSAMTKLSPASVLVLVLLLPLPLISADGLRKGWEALNKEDYQSAMSAYEEVLKEVPSSAAQAQAYLGLGSAAYRMGNYEQAADEFSRAVTTGAPEIQTQALYNLGNTLFRRGESALKAMQSKQSGQPGPQMNEQSRASAIKDWETAIEHYQGSLSLNPQSKNTQHNLEVVKKHLEELKKEQEKDEEKQQQQQNQNQDQQKKDQDQKDKQDSQQGQNQQQGPQKKDQDKSQDGKQGDSSQQNQSGSENQSNGMNPDQKDQKDQKGQGDQKDSEKDSQHDPNSQDQKQNSPASKPDPADAPPESQEPQDGKLEANPNQASQEQPAQTRPMQEGDAEQEMNPETGYAPSEVRHLLESLTDETAVRLRSPKPSGYEKKFKDW